MTGASVNALARSEKTADLVESLGAVPIQGDLDDIEALRRGCEEFVLESKSLYFSFFFIFFLFSFCEINGFKTIF